MPLIDGKAVLHSEPANVGLGKDEAVTPYASDTIDVLLRGRACLDILNFNLAHMTDGTLQDKARYFCSPCKVGFEFKSRYERHPETASHQAYTQCVSMDEATLITLTEYETARGDGDIISTTEESVMVSSLGHYNMI